LDIDAAAYIIAITQTGITVSTIQSAAINSFIEGEKIAGRWSNIKRFYLPIWGVAAANAIDMVARGSGTFVGGVTHSARFFTTNGTTGAFRDNATITSLGTTIDTHHTIVLVSDNPATSGGFARYFGAYDSTDLAKDCSVLYLVNYHGARPRGFLSYLMVKTLCETCTGLTLP
jgi:hypothetical protein